jgi:hypothetical protein
VVAGVSLAIAVNRFAIVGGPSACTTRVEDQRR